MTRDRQNTVQTLTPTAATFLPLAMATRTVRDLLDKYLSATTDLPVGAHH